MLAFLHIIYQQKTKKSSSSSEQNELFEMYTLSSDRFSSCTFLNSNG